MSVPAIAPLPLPTRTRPALVLPTGVASALVRAQAAAHRGARRCLRRITAETGEGVISAAIAVLIMAFLGALMWAAFKEVFAGATAKTKAQIDLIGG